MNLYTKVCENDCRASSLSHVQLCDQSSVRGFLLTFTFLGKLVDVVPSLPQSLASSHVPLLERLCTTLLYPDEGLKASVFYVWQMVWGFLKQLLKLGEVVSVLMNSPCEKIRSDLDQSLDQDQEAQSSTQLSLERCGQCSVYGCYPGPLPQTVLCFLHPGRRTWQPAGVRLFPSAPGFVAVAEAVPSGVCSPSLQVATQAAHALTHSRTDGQTQAVSTTNMSYSLCTVCLCRVNHQSSPVQYKQLEKLVEDIIARCTELPLPASSRCRVSLRGDEPSSQASRAGGFLLQALVCFHAAFRLVEQCSSEPGLKENVFTAPSKQVQGQDPLESLCLGLLHCCDTVCIPTITVSPAPSTHTFMHHMSTCVEAQ
ncbi:meiosis inhibitor protein 1-like [Oncorhynchus kisutch]|uniref:meiosis inhibitor protein 1-like n=1 Tax=Oncorhynchus kisutch TaxID=8019 RepID=UPI0012DCAE5E|nr:meiosis inhibitor protein 1-like [Oncorhynchus kisutch]